MPTNKLTDAKCRAAKAGDRAQKLFDGNGLFLWVSTSGAKTWRIAYRKDGKPQTHAVGPYPEVGLAEARQKCLDVRKALRANEDPRPVRQAAPKMLFSVAVTTYWNGRKDVTDGYRANALRAIAMHLEPALGKRDIGSLAREDILAELRRMDLAGKHVYVRKVRMWVSQVFDWAVENKHAEINPAALIDPRKAFGHAEVEHFAALTLPEMPAFMQRLAVEDQALQSVLACRLLGYLWTRTVELRQMRKTEREGDLWRIPRARMKSKRDHLVPLPRQACEILDLLEARSPGGEYVMPADHRIDRPMSENSILYLIHRMGYKGRMTGHGWRSVASTWANENGYSPDAIEKQLAHESTDKTRAVYNRAEYLPERRVMLQAWADWLDSCGSSRN